MSWAFGGVEVRAQLRAAFARRLEPAGWRMLEVQDQSSTLAAFIHPLDGELAATAEIERGRPIPDIPRQFLIRVDVGVSYERLRALSPLLGRFAVDVVGEAVWPHRSGGDGDDEDESDPVVTRVEIDGADDVDRAVGRLSAVILEHAIPFARRYGDLEALLEAVRGHG